MQGTWNHGRPHYRCRYPSEYAAATERHPKSVYVREAQVVPKLDDWLTTLFDENHLDATIDLLLAGLATTDRDEAVAMAKRSVARCDAKLASYRATLDAGGDPETVAKWMADVAQEQQAAKDALALARSVASAVASASLSAGPTSSAWCARWARPPRC